MHLHIKAYMEMCFRQNEIPLIISGYFLTPFTCDVIEFAQMLDSITRRLRRGHNVKVLASGIIRPLPVAAFVANIFQSVAHLLVNFTTSVLIVVNPGIWIYSTEDVTRFKQGYTSPWI